MMSRIDSRHGKISTGHHFQNGHHNTAQIQHCPISTTFHMWVDYDVPKWFLTSKNFYRSPFSKWPPQYRTNSTLSNFNDIFLSCPFVTIKKDCDLCLSSLWRNTKLCLPLPGRHIVFVLTFGHKSLSVQLLLYFSREFLKTLNVCLSPYGESHAVFSILIGPFLTWNIL